MHVGDCIEVLRGMDDSCVQTCVTSPPYFGLRDYGHAGQIGLEETPGEYVARLVDVFREVRRVLRDNGTVWLNLGDSYASGGRGGGGSYMAERGDKAWQGKGSATGWRSAPAGFKHKDLLLMPARVAIALQEDGWYVRQDIIWRKPNPMPESVTDRCTKSHEYIFLISKSPRYYFDRDAIAEPLSESSVARLAQAGLSQQKGSYRQPGKTNGSMKAVGSSDGTRNKRSVWDVPTQSFRGAHFAVFPPDLIRPCVLAGAPEGGVVLDPFAGAGTTGVVCAQERREFVGIELNPEYAALAGERIAEAEAIAACSWDQLPLLAGGAP